MAETPRSEGLPKNADRGGNEPPEATQAIRGRTAPRRVLFGSTKEDLREPLDPRPRTPRRERAALLGDNRPGGKGRASERDAKNRLSWPMIWGAATVLPIIGGITVSEVSGDGSAREIVLGSALIFGIEAVGVSVLAFRASDIHPRNDMNNESGDGRKRKLGKYALIGGVCVAAAIALAVSDPSSSGDSSHHSATPSHTSQSPVQTHHDSSLVCHRPHQIAEEFGDYSWNGDKNTKPKWLAETLSEQFHREITGPEVDAANPGLFQDGRATVKGYSCVYVPQV